MTATLMKSLFSRISLCRAKGPAATSAKTSSGVGCVRLLITLGEVLLAEREILYVCIWIDAVHFVALMV
jgi:hypothetical protein